jgi:AcrR family transcriptional regulator
MDPERKWFFHDVAGEFIAKGFTRPDYRVLAEARGGSEKEIRQRFPSSQKLATSLIDEIFTPFKEEVFRIAKQQEETDSRERLIQMLAAGFDYYEDHPILTQVIINALFGTDEVIHEHVHDAFREIVSMIVDDILDAQIIPYVSPMMISDLTSVMLSLLFLGGCPELMMDYLGFVNTRRVAASALKAMRARYHSPSFAR